MSELELVGKTVKLQNPTNSDLFDTGELFVIQDAAPVVFDKAVYKAVADGNEFATEFAGRAASWWDLNHSFYGTFKDGDGARFIVHLSEIGEVVS